MSYSYNKKHRRKRAFNKKLAKSFGEFCEQKGIVNYNTLSDEYREDLIAQWQSYKRFYRIH
jgi:hypothetical protein